MEFRIKIFFHLKVHPLFSIIYTTSSHDMQWLFVKILLYYIQVTLFLITVINCCIHFCVKNYDCMNVIFCIIAVPDIVLVDASASEQADVVLVLGF